MKTTDINNTIIDGYIRLLDNLSPSNKLDLISKLTLSVKSDISEKKKSFYKAFDAWNSNLTDNATVLITARCGLGRLPEDVTTHELTIHPFTSLPESTWVVDVPR